MLHSDPAHRTGRNPNDVTIGVFQALEGDADGDSDINITNFNTLATNFTAAGYDGVSASIPEPTSFLLLALGVVVMGCYLSTRRIQ